MVRDCGQCLDHLLAVLSDKQRGITKALEPVDDGVEGLLYVLSDDAAAETHDGARITVQNGNVLDDQHTVEGLT